MKMYSSELFSPELLREKFENGLEISGKTQGIWLLKNVATLMLMSLADMTLADRGKCFANLPTVTTNRHAAKVFISCDPGMLFSKFGGGGRVFGQVRQP